MEFKLGNLKNKIRDYVPLILFMACYCVLIIKLDVNYGDEVILAELYKDKNVYDAWKLMTSQWAPPSLGIVIQYFFIKNPIWIFKVTYFFIMWLIFHSLNKMINNEKDIYVKYILLIYCLLYPILRMNSAGWMVTSIVYIFPLSMGLYCFTSISDIFFNKRTNKIIILIALLFALTNPQLSLISMGVNAFFSIYFIVMKEKKYKFFVIQAILSLISVLIQFTSKGYSLRYVAEIQRWFPDFRMLSLIEKINLGISNSMVSLICNHSILMLFFTTVMIVYIYNYNRNMYDKVIATIPLLFIVVFGFLRNIMNDVFPSLVSGLINHRKIMIENYDSIISYVPIGLILLFLFCICMSLYNIFEDKKIGILTVLIFIAGFLSTMVLALSPTIYASAERIFIFFDFSIIMCAAYATKEFFKKISINSKDNIISFALVVSCIQFVQYLCFVN